MVKERHELLFGTNELRDALVRFREKHDEPAIPPSIATTVIESVLLATSTAQDAHLLNRFDLQRSTEDWDDVHLFVKGRDYLRSLSRGRPDVLFALPSALVLGILITECKNKGLRLPLRAKKHLFLDGLDIGIRYSL